MNLGEITPRTDYQIDHDKMEEPLFLHYSVNGWEYVSFSAKIRDRYFVGKGVVFGAPHWMPFLIEFDSKTIKIIADNPDDQKHMPQDEDTKKRVCDFLLSPFDRDLLSPKPCSREVN
jgi:hypothetical protein